MQTKMVVSGLSIDPSNNAPVVVLREHASERVLPIWIGVIEASAIAFELERVRLARPMTHDLLRTTVEALGGTVRHVSIVDLKGGTFYATVSLAQGTRRFDVDARPSDAIALALRAQASIFCAPQVIEAGAAKPALELGLPATVRPPTLQQGRPRAARGPKPIVATRDTCLKTLLESLTPEDFGKYEM